jgi:hypothetical protein
MSIAQNEGMSFEEVNDSISKPKSKKRKGTRLRHLDAIYRSTYISNVSYNITMALPKGKKYFGNVYISFILKDLPIN